MSRSPELGAALFNTEASWAEVSTVFGTRVQTIGPIKVDTLKREKLVPQYTTQFLNEIKPGVNGVYSGEFTIDMMLTGHGSTTAGVITLNALETLLGIFLGSVAAASSAGTTATAGGTATALNVALASGYVAGSLVGPIGSIGDGRGNGQFSVVNTHATSIINLLVAIDAALNNGDVVRNPAVAYTIENPTASHAVTSTRWRFQSANLEYDCRGCYPKKIEIKQLDPAGEPMVSFTFGASYYEESNPAFPSVTSVQTFPHAPVANGSFFLGSYGSTTRTQDVTKLNARSFAITWDLGIVERRGPGGVNPGQVTVGCTRVRSQGSVDVVFDAPDATTTPDLVTKWKSNAPLHMAYVWGAADSQGGALYSPYVVPDGDSPIQFDNGGINSLRFKGRLGTDATKSTDLERSALRIAQG